MKRILDLMIAFSGLILLSPVFLLISIMIAIKGNGPIFFKQNRVGKGGKIFVLYKFRSMNVLESAKYGSFDPGDPSRITPLGKYIRKTKLDELPQLLNVLKGEMSLVGPRPEVEKWVAIYPERWRNILVLKPGITDNASIHYRLEESILKNSDNPETTYKNLILPRKLDYYEEYLSNHSVIGDIKIIIKTLFYIVHK